jgi:hypothetical protein
VFHDHVWLWTNGLIKIPRLWILQVAIISAAVERFWGPLNQWSAVQERLGYPVGMEAAAMLCLILYSHACKVCLYLQCWCLSWLSFHGTTHMALAAHSTFPPAWGGESLVVMHFADAQGRIFIHSCTIHA